MPDESQPSGFKEVPKRGYRYYCTQCSLRLEVLADSECDSPADVEFICHNLTMWKEEAKLQAGAPMRYNQIIAGVLVVWERAGDEWKQISKTPISPDPPPQIAPVVRLGDDPYTEIENHPATVPPNPFGESLSDPNRPSQE